MKTANLERELIDLRVKGVIQLPELDSFCVKDICLIIERFCPQTKLCPRTIQKAIQRIEAPPIQWVGNAPYYSRLYVKAALIYLKFEVKDDGNNDSRTDCS